MPKPAIISAQAAGSDTAPAEEFAVSNALMAGTSAKLADRMRSPAPVVMKFTYRDTFWSPSPRRPSVRGVKLQLPVVEVIVSWLWKSGEEASAPDEVPDYSIAYNAGKALNAVIKAVGESGFGGQWVRQGAPLSRTISAADPVALLWREAQVT